MTMPRVRLVVILTVTCVACSDSTGPSQALPGRLLDAGRGPFEWSRDGMQLYYRTDSGYGGPIRAVNVATGVSRVVIPTCASSPQETITGLAYISECVAPLGLHMLMPGDSTRPRGYDSVLVPGVTSVLRSADRTRLIYPVWSVGGGPDSIGVIDLVRGTRHVVATGLFDPTAAVSPGGTEMLVERSGATGEFAILNLDDGSLRILDDSVFLLPVRPGSVPSPLPVGWNDAGLWVVTHGGVGGVAVYDPVTETWRGAGAQGSRVTVETPGRRAAVGQSHCVGEDSAGCVLISHSLVVVDPLQGLQQPLVQFTTTEVFKYSFGFYAAFSPNGDRLAYSLGFELRLVTLPRDH